ncbi:hypothetical protein F5050DRAFT_465003 [Lentinula boryana]|uniref:Xylosidase/arabinosidase n=1 Tax=Lentinula boryana TaxID=40481 RepID=A0ABQ8Q7N4_9AGAR|nr:hypothetical protein F5050DRAFT_465003 [Lentinula boryana]
MSPMGADYARYSFRRVDPTTIQRKFLVGYQGWFTCRGDGAGLDNHGWSHWLKDGEEESPLGGKKLATDLWPDMSRYPPSELYPVPGFKHKSGEHASLFSSCNPNTVRRHFNWMACHGIDGVFLQRFVGQCDPWHPNYKAIIDGRDKVGNNVRLAAEAEGRVFCIMYDVSGVSPNRVQQVLEHDWSHLIREQCLLDSPNYLQERGKPVLCLWGFGFSKIRYDPDTVRAIISFFRESTPGGVYIIAGVPAHWRTGDGDSDPNPEFLKLWLNHCDAISPWTVGRYKTEEEATRYANEIMKVDIETLTVKNQSGQNPHGHVDYIPVVLPGGSGYNMSGGKWAFNNIKREGGRFLWRQIYNATKHGAKIIYGATWDEYDEGTALMPAVESRLLLPISHQSPLLPLDEDGYTVPADWYMRICGLTAGYLRSESQLQEEFPYETLRDQCEWVQAESSVEDALLPPPYYSSQGGSLSSDSQKIWTTSRRSPLRGPRSRPLPNLPASAPFLSDLYKAASSFPATPSEFLKDTSTEDFTVLQQFRDVSAQSENSAVNSSQESHNGQQHLVQHFQCQDKDS